MSIVSFRPKNISKQKKTEDLLCHPTLLQLCQTQTFLFMKKNSQISYCSTYLQAQLYLNPVNTESSIDLNKHNLVQYAFGGLVVRF